MNTKLTLRLDERLIKRAKAHARRAGKSVSQVVAEYFSLLGSDKAAGAKSLTPAVRALKGSIKRSGASRNEYRRHLEEKYL